MQRNNCAGSSMYAFDCRDRCVVAPNCADVDVERTRHEGAGSMFKVGKTVQLSASDLVGHLNCRNLTELDLAVAKGALAKPRVLESAPR